MQLAELNQIITRTSRVLNFEQSSSSAVLTRGILACFRSQKYAGTKWSKIKNSKNIRYPVQSFLSLFNPPPLLKVLLSRRELLGME